MNKLFVAVTLTLELIFTPLYASESVRTLSNEEVRAEELENRYGCSAIFDIERSWHKVYVKEGCGSYSTPRYGYAIEKIQKEIKRLKLHHVYMKLTNASKSPSGFVISGAGKYDQHISILFLTTLIEYDQKIKPARNSSLNQ